MRLVTLFNGPVPVPPRLYVVGVDQPRPDDRAHLEALQRDLQFLRDLCALPSTPFSGRFSARVWQ